MSNILLLRGFNNYHKRTILKYSTLVDYQDNSASFLNYSSINFNPNDGIVTELIVGNDAQLENSKILSFDDVGSPDYLVVYDTDTESNITIKSRWFILESVKTTAGQFRLALKRDVIADHMDWILNTDCFIEKAQIMDIYSPFIFNNESMTYNQIKKKEIPLYDSTGVPWLVGYIAKSYDGNNGSSFDCTGSISDAQDTDFLTLAETPFDGISTTDLLNGITFRTISHYTIFPTQFTAREGTWYPNMTAGFSLWNIDSNNEHTYEPELGLYYESSGGATIRNAIGDLGLFSAKYGNTVALVNVVRPLSSEIATIECSSMITSGIEFANKVYENLTQTNAQLIMNELNSASSINHQGKAAIESFNLSQVKIGPKYYQLQISFVNYAIGNESSGTLSASSKTNLLNATNNAVQTLTGQTTYITPTGARRIPLYAVYADFSVRMREVPATLTVKVKCPNKADRWTCNDQLFDMFCIPYGAMNIDDDLKSGGTVQTITTRKDAALAAARALAASYGSGNIYDLQILPYCPIKNIRDAYTPFVSRIKSIGGTDALVDPYIKYTGNFEIDSDDAGKLGSYQRIYDNNSEDVLNYVFWATDSHGSFDVKILTSDDKYYQYTSVTESKILRKKISNETEIFRLCSPNYNGLFEYSAAKNNNQEIGVIEHRETSNPDYGDQFYPDMTTINVDYTYRPSNPYIHLNPAFKGEENGGIYGQDWNDARGLICGGEFSMGYIVDAFRSYQIQNANFQNIFNRQIQNIDFNNALAKEQIQYASIMSAIGLPIGGATTGALAGAKLGGGYGAVAGAAIGGIGGAIGSVGGYTLNMEWLEKQQQETRSYAVDMYNYQLGNIKALPYSISRTDCLAENTRLVPFLEIYEATNREVENLKNVLKYNGMTLMIIDKPINYIASDNYESHYENSVSCHGKACYYIKAKLIMNTQTELPDDFHTVDAIYAELDKGVYIQGYEEE